LTGLRESREVPVERNLFLYAMLGLSHRAGRVEAFIQDQLLAPPEASSSAAPASPAVYAVLGALSFSRTVGGLLAGWSREGEIPPASPGTAVESRRVTRSLLR
jgi:hypothetical protein